MASGKPAKGAILGAFVAVTGPHRKHAIHMRLAASCALSSSGRRRYKAGCTGCRRQGPKFCMFAKIAATALALLIAAVVPSGAAVAPGDGDAAGNDVIGDISWYVTRYEDTMPELARRFDLGFVELMIANPGLEAWVPGADRQILVPSAHILPDGPRKGIVVNLAELRLYYFHQDGSIETVPVGIGRDYWQTPEVHSAIARKRKDPVWTPPASIRAEKPELPASIGPGPDNPLGAFAMDLGYDSYVIHGTNKPLGVGRRVSHGCIRLYPEDIARLFSEVPVGTPVRIIDQQIKLGWSGGALFLEAHPSQQQVDEVEAGKTLEHDVDLPAMMVRISEMPGAADADLDWALIERALRERSGVPVRISRP